MIKYLELDKNEKEELNEKIRDELLKHEKIYVIAEKLDCEAHHVAFVRDKMLEEGCDVTKKVVRPDRSIIRDMLHEGKSNKEIMQKVGCSYGAISYYRNLEKSGKDYEHITKPLLYEWDRVTKELLFRKRWDRERKRVLYGLKHGKKLKGRS